MKHDPEDTHVPTKKCAKGHVIPLNGDFVYQGGRRVALKSPRLICEQCAKDAGGKIHERHTRLPKGQIPEGQESLLKGVPGLSIK